MKKLITSICLLVATSSLFAQFTQGNLVVYQVGDGSAALTSSATPTFLKEFSTAGAATYSLAVPTTTVSGARLENSGSATSEGLITRSIDGRYIVISGYDAATGTGGVTSSSGSTINRVIDTIDYAGNLGRAAASSTFYSGNNIRSAASDGNNNYWGGGVSQGTSYMGSGTPATLTTVNTRQIGIFNNQLYYTTSSTAGVYQTGTGMPTTGPQTPVLTFSTTGSPYGFYFNVTSDTCYVADDASGIKRYTFNGTAWSVTTMTATNARGIIVDFNVNPHMIYATTTATSANTIIKFQDLGTTASTQTIVATAPTNTAFRGIAFSPYCAMPVISNVTNVTPACDNKMGLSVTTSAGLTPFTYAWSGPGTFVSSTVQTPTVTGAATGVYSVAVTNACGTTTSTVSINVNAAPTLSSPTATTCLGVPIVLSVSGADTYTWSPAITLSSANGSTVTATASSTIIYNIKGTDVNGCKSSTTTTLTTNNLPNIQAVASETAICTGTSETVTLTASNVDTYTWSANANSASTSTTVIMPSATDTYSLAGTDANGCVNTTAVVVTVNNLPTVQATTTSTLVCSGTTFTLSGSGATTYTWTNGVTDGAATTSTTTTTYTVMGTDDNGCVNSDMLTVNVNALPDVVASATPTVICMGDNTTLSGSGATSYTWANAGIADGVAFTPTTTANYTVTGTDNNNCTNWDTITVTVNSLPNIMANASPTVVCIGDNTTLSGSGATTYTWTSGVMNGSAFTPTTTVNYTVTGTDNNNCVNWDTITVTVNSLPNVMANASPTVVCMGDNTTLSGSGATSYTWTNGVTDGIAFTPTATVNYTVTGTDNNNCVNWDTITVAVNSLPNVMASATTASLCAGVDTLNASGAVTYMWSSNASSATTASVSINAMTSDTYTVTGTDANGCVNMAMVSTMVNALPNVMASSSSTVVCAGTTTTLTATGANTYTWSTGDNGNTDVITPLSNNSGYMVTGTGANGCMNTVIVNVSVDSIVLNLTITNASCSGMCNANCTVVPQGGNAPYNYSWSDGSTAPIGSNLCAGTGTVQVMDANGCSSIANYTITAPSAININLTYNSFTCTGINDTIASTVSGGTPTYSISIAPISSVVAPYLNGFIVTENVVGAYIYTVTVIDASNCSTSSEATINYGTDCDMGITKINHQNNFVLYPNPATSQVTIQSSVELGTVTIYNALGAVVEILEIKDTTSQIDIDRYAPGIYTILAQGSYHKVIKQ